VGRCRETPSSGFGVAELILEPSDQPTVASLGLWIRVVDAFESVLASLSTGVWVCRAHRTINEKAWKVSIP
jgi:hypothetical protein